MSPLNWLRELFARAVFEGCVEGFERFRGHMAGDCNAESLGDRTLPGEAQSGKTFTPNVDVTSSPPLAQWVERLRLPNTGASQTPVETKASNQRRPRKRADNETLG